MNPGTGPGAITPDGCAVEVYLRLPPLGEAEIVHAAAGERAAVLDLGCGTGRIAHRLIELGHEVVGVDESAEMLAHVRGARTVCSTIAELRLDRRFGAVLLASNLVNTADDDTRHAVLAAAARHLARGGVLVAEWHPPSWFDTVTARHGGRLGAMRVDLDDVHREEDLLRATVRYVHAADVWTQTFTARRLDDAALHRELRKAGLSFDRWLRADRTWFAARRAAEAG